MIARQQFTGMQRCDVLRRELFILCVFDLDRLDGAGARGLYDRGRDLGDVDALPGVGRDRVNVFSASGMQADAPMQTSRSTSTFIEPICVGPEGFFVSLRSIFFFCYFLCVRSASSAF